MKVELENGWQAEAPSVRSGFIFVLALTNPATGERVERTRFDRGKLRFLDRQAEIPQFTSATLTRLAKELTAAAS